MTEPMNRTSPGVKTLGVKLPDELHSQFSLVAGLNDLSLNDAVVAAVKLYIDTNKARPDFNERATAALAAIEAEAQARRGAIESLFAQTPDAAESTKTARRTKE
jgi:hypothetical protein